MKSINTKNKRINTPVVWIIVVVALAVIIAGTIFFFQKNQQVDRLSAGPTQQEAEQQNADASKQKEDFLDNEKNNEDAMVSPVPTSTDSIGISFSTQNDSVVASIKLDGQGYSQGTCVLTVKNGSKSQEQSAEIIYQPEYSTCAGFSVQKAKLGTGTWTVSLKVTPTNGSTLTKEVTYEAK